jgi:hypothetical protein
MSLSNGHHDNGHASDEAIDSLYSFWPGAADPPALPEAPASVNVRVQIGGREVQWTLRDTDEARLAGRLEALLARYPLPERPPVQPPPAASQGQEGYCAKHGVPMSLQTREGSQWWSHLHAGKWCKGK